MKFRNKIIRIHKIILKWKLQFEEDDETRDEVC